MQIEEKQIILDASWFSAEREIQRSKGLHLSHVINFIEDGGISAHREGRSDSLNNYAVSGFLWERIIDRVINLSKEELFEWLFTRAMFDVSNPKLVRVGEVCVEVCKCCSDKKCIKCKGTGSIKMYLTPDAYYVDEELMEEHKWTTKSSRNEISSDKFVRWTQYQIPIYLKVLGLKKCRLRVCFSRGDYKSGEPEWKEFLLTYSNRELEEAFEMVMLNARYMVENGLVNYSAV